MSDWAYCPKCATPLPPDAEKCPACGAITPSAPTVQSDPGAEQPPTDEDLAALEKKLEAALSPSFVLVRRLGTGGMGSVFLARDPALKRLVAVKVLAPALAADSGARARFEREAQSVARLSHPNIVAIHSVGQLDDGTPYFVMQHVGGQSLAARLAEDGPFSPDDTRRIVGEVASALAAAHAQGIIHRDIKPANVLYDDESGRVLVSDFGIAAVRPTGEQPKQTKLTMTGMAVGTPQYMSPEQLLAEEVTEKTDIYALGLLGYELLSGAGPFQATSPQELIAAHLRDTPKLLSEIRDDVDPELESAITRCLAKDPQQRLAARDIAQQFTLGGDRLLEWPPPGLGTLHGRLPSVSNHAAVASLLVALAFLTLVWLGPELSSPTASLGTLFIALFGLAGVITLFPVTRRLVLFGKEATRAVHAGFGWLTVAETLVDRRGDTGALIAGVREYAALSLEQRSQLRKGRLIREGALLLGGIAPLLSVLALVSGALAHIVGPVTAPIIVLLPSVGLAAAAWVAQHGEIRAVGPARTRLAKHRRTREQDPGVVHAWNETLEQARGGQKFGAGPATHPLAGRVAAIGAVIGVLAVVAVLLPIVIVGVLGPGLWEVGYPRWSTLEERLRIAKTARDFGITPDSSITPIEAGMALYALTEMGRTDRARSRAADYYRPLPVVYDRLWFETVPAGLFVRGDSAGVNDARSSDGYGPDSRNILEYAARGLTAAEREYLRQVAAHPAWAEFHTVARARAVDVLGGRFELPFPDTVTVWEVPYGLISRLREAGYGAVAVAALLMQQGRLEEAEDLLQETVSFGFRIIDDGPFTIETLIGAIVVATARDALERFYRIQGRKEAEVLRARYDSVVAEPDDVEQRLSTTGMRNAHVLRLGLLRLARNVQHPRGIRYGALHSLFMAPCANSRELLFGVEGDIEAALARADSQLVRFESERELLRLMRASPERVPSVEGFEVPPPVWVATGLGRLSGWVLHSDRISACTWWATAGIGLM